MAGISLPLVEQDDPKRLTCRAPTDFSKDHYRDRIRSGTVKKDLPGRPTRTFAPRHSIKGNAVISDSLLAAFAVNFEHKFWNAVGSVEESVIILNHIGDLFAEQDQPRPAAPFFFTAEETADRNDLVRKAVVSHEQFSTDTLGQEDDRPGESPEGSLSTRADHCPSFHTAAFFRMKNKSFQKSPDDDKPNGHDGNGEVVTILDVTELKKKLTAT